MPWHVEDKTIEGNWSILQGSVQVAVAVTREIAEEIVKAHNARLEENCPDTASVHCKELVDGLVTAVAKCQVFFGEAWTKEDWAVIAAGLQHHIRTHGRCHDTIPAEDAPEAVDSRHRY